MNINVIQKIRSEVMDICENDYNVNKQFDFWNDHIKFVVYHALELAQQYGADKEVVELAALLHDIAMPSAIGPQEEHHIYGEKIAEEMLQKFNYPEDKLQLVKNVS